MAPRGERCRKYSAKASRVSRWTGIESPENARNTYKALKRNYARRLAWKANKLGQPVPDIATDVLSPRDIVDLNKAGMLSKEAALAALKRKGGLP